MDKVKVWYIILVYSISYTVVHRFLIIDIKYTLHKTRVFIIITNIICLEIYMIIWVKVIVVLKLSLLVIIKIKVINKLGISAYYKYSEIYDLHISLK